MKLEKKRKEKQRYKQAKVKPSHPLPKKVTKTLIKKEQKQQYKDQIQNASKGRIDSAVDWLTEARNSHRIKENVVPGCVLPL